MNNPEILVIDDEAQIRKLLEIILQNNDYQVRLASNAREGLMMAINHPPDLIILDLGLPDDTGHNVLKRLREWYTRPVIILSVQSDESDIVRALDNGANDYLIKPFRTGELVARIRSAIRIASSGETVNTILTFDDKSIDLANRVVKKNNEAIKLTSTEYTLLALFVKNEGKVLTHQYLLKEVWGPGFIGESQYLRVYIAQIRKKIENDPNRPKHLLTESGVGYRFVATI
jgi:two-component system KDP operon response regulator KdpE